MTGTASVPSTGATGAVGTTGTTGTTVSPIRVGLVTLSFERPVIMGILNCTPDSFSDGGTIATVEAAVVRAREMVKAGALVLDVGGESTRPGSEPVPAGLEIQRVIPLIKALTAESLPAAISIDTSKAEVARAALDAGASIVNDVTALRDPEMAEVVARAHAAIVLMHMRGEPRSMQAGPIHYADLLGEIGAALEVAIARAVAVGVVPTRIIVDPGLGFGKSVEHNLSLTKHLDYFHRFGKPVLYGASRKRFLGELTGRAVDDRDRATASACALAVAAGAHILRVHNVEAVRDAVAIATAVRDAP